MFTRFPPSSLSLFDALLAKSSFRELVYLMSSAASTPDAQRSPYSPWFVSPVEMDRPKYISARPSGKGDENHKTSTAMHIRTVSTLSNLSKASDAQSSKPHSFASSCSNSVAAPPCPTSEDDPASKIRSFIGQLKIDNCDECPTSGGDGDHVDTQSVSQTCLELATMAREDGYHKALIAASGGIGAIVSSMTTNVGDRNVQLSGCAALESLYWRNPASLLSFVRSGGVGAMISILQIYCYDTDVGVRICSVLSSVTTAYDAMEQAGLVPADLLMDELNRWNAGAVVRAAMQHLRSNVSAHSVSIWDGSDVG